MNAHAIYQITAAKLYGTELHGFVREPLWDIFPWDSTVSTTQLGNGRRLGQIDVFGLVVAQLLHFPFQHKAASHKPGLGTLCLIWVESWCFWKTQQRRSWASMASAEGMWHWTKLGAGRRHTDISKVASHEDTVVALV